MLTTMTTGAGAPTASTAEQTSDAARSWRNVLPIHPAADLFPLMSETDPSALKELGEDIKKSKLREPIVLWSSSTHKDVEAYATDLTTKGAAPEWFLLDGRNRLDALELIGKPMDLLDDPPGDRPFIGAGISVRHLYGNTDPYAYVISANIRRRHLSADDKRDLIANLVVGV